MLYVDNLINKFRPVNQLLWGISPSEDNVCSFGMLSKNSNTSLTSKSCSAKPNNLIQNKQMGLFLPNNFFREFQRIFSQFFVLFAKMA
jgi:hypothetical protein